MKGLVAISKYAGVREDLVQASGGNSSVKIDNTMYIKASGYHLYDITENDGYAEVDYKKIVDCFSNGQLENMNESEGKKILNDVHLSGKRPSIETFFHSLPYKYVLHTHPTLVNVLTCRKDWEKILGELFPDALLVPYATPGIELANLYFKEYEKHKDNYMGVAFLQNHGVVVSADDYEEVINKTEKLLLVIERYLNIDYSDYHFQTTIAKLFNDKIVLKVNDYDVINYCNKGLSLQNFGFCPDAIVFLGRSILELVTDEIEEEINEYKNVNGNPVVIKHNKAVYIIADSIRKALDIQSVLSFCCKVMYYNKDEEYDVLGDKAKNLLLGWEAEKYRQKL